MYIATTEYEKTLRAYNLGLVFDLFFLWWKSGDVPYCESPSSEFDHVKKGDTLYGMSSVFSSVLILNIYFNINTNCCL
jgi:hypothetical protein